MNRRVFIVAHPYEIGLERLEKDGFRPLVATDNPLPTLFERGDDVVAIIGIGAGEARPSLEWMKDRGYFSGADVLLAGSAGSYSLPVLHVVQCCTGYPEWASGYDKGEIVCVHEFVSPENPHPELHVPGTCFDMESETLLDVCRDAGVQTLSIVKVISDDGSGSLGDWATVCQQKVQPKVWKVLTRFFKNML